MSTSRKTPRSLERMLLELIESGRLPRAPAHPCPYLSDRDASEEGFVIDQLPGRTYHVLMDHGFRRSGRVVYRPRCEGCRSCVPLRIPTSAFVPTRSQRRVWRRNVDLKTRVGPPVLDDEKHELYARYLTVQHPGSAQGDDANALRDFLYTSAVDTIEVTYFTQDDRLLAASLLDISPWSLSSVYHFFDPDERRRSLGVYSVMAEIELARHWGIPYYYLGYWIAEAPTMHYKANYFAHEVLVDGQWQRRHRTASAVAQDSEELGKNRLYPRTTENDDERGGSDPER